MIDTHELAWAAGFFDGEGHIAYKRGARNNDPQRYIWKNIILEIAQKDRFVLDRFQKAVNCGAVYGPYRNGANDKNKGFYSYRYVASSFYKIRDAVNLMWPWLSPLKRIQAEEAITGWLNEPRMRVGRKRGERVVVQVA